MKDSRGFAKAARAGLQTDQIRRATAAAPQLPSGGQERQLAKSNLLVPNRGGMASSVASPPPNPAQQGAASGPAGFAAGQRLMSVDALRGFDMIWIVGAASIARALDRMGDSGLLQGLAAQLVHPEWAGFTFFDLIFPLFVFIVGVSLVFSLSRTIAVEGRPAAVRRIFRRAFLLFLLGIFYGGGFSRPFEEIRWVGVLQRIALCYFFAGILFCYFRPRVLGGICAALIVGYWMVMTFVPVPGIGPPSYAEGANLANWIDHQLLPGRLYRGTWDPEGILSTFPAVATCLLGLFAGLLLRESKIPDRQKTAWLLSAGAAGALLGWLWGFQFPINKHIWSSSFVLLTGGLSAMLLGIFYQMIDVWGWRKGFLPFVWVGTNAITIYLAHNLMQFGQISRRLAGGDVMNFLNGLLPGLGEVVISALVLGLSFLFCWFLYRRKLFLRL